MVLSPTIPSHPETDPALDQRQLFERGLTAIRRLSGQGWTDHNTHDPGITQLELLAYALTDLGYRARFPIEDLLAVPGDNATAMGRLFAKAADILPNAPVTLADYRKLLIDLKGVKNAWLHPAPVTLMANPVTGKLHRQPSGHPAERAITVTGRYQATIEFMDDVRSSERRQAIRRDVLATLHDNRGLGLDFVKPVLEVQVAWFSLCAEIDLSAEADIVQVAAEIRFSVDRFLAPPVLNYPLADMLARRHGDGTPWTLPEIFEGPALANGFIPDDELAAAEMRREVRLSDVISVIMDIPGVVAIRDILMNPAAAGLPQEPADKWRLPVPAGHQPRLTEQFGRIALYKRNLPMVPDADAVNSRIDSMLKAERRKLEGGIKGDWPIPLGRYRNPAEFNSVQGDFPALYGLSEAGLSATASPQRRAQALQFKGWLTIFDHILASYAAQLAHVRDLFSTNPDLAASYFSQQVRSYPEWEKIYAAGFDDSKLADIVESRESGVLRRNSFLDHLLARYAEDFADLITVMQGRFGMGPAQAAQTKCRFLSDYPHIGAERGLGYNASLNGSDELWGSSSNLSGYERRIVRLLDIANPARRNLSAVSYDMYSQVYKLPDSTPEYRFRLRQPISGKILLSSSTLYATADAARTEMEQAIARAQLPEGYQRKLTGTAATPEARRRWYFNIVDAAEKVIARRIEYFTSKAAMESAIAELMVHLRNQYSSEGLYVIEHLLCLTDAAEDPLMDICIDPGGADCADLDPYSNRLTIVLPAYSGRFRDMDFRRFVETTLRGEAPAHLLPRICWVNSDDMAAIESAYRDWLAIRSGAASSAAAAKLGRLINALTRAKNVYPPGALHPCGQLKPQPFILGQAALGSATEIPQS